MVGYEYVKPTNPGGMVRDPLQRTVLPENGAWVAWVGKDGKYWRRRLNDGSIVICNPPEIKEEITEIKKKREVK